MKAPLVGTGSRTADLVEIAVVVVQVDRDMAADLVSRISSLLFVDSILLGLGPTGVLADSILTSRPRSQGASGVVLDGVHCGKQIDRTDDLGKQNVTKLYTIHRDTE